ncbi:hypothetical protein GPALN_012339 [Globodera pallida]|nr:hypothetical protein GPALN_012339 [Globodera pallida]
MSGRPNQLNKRGPRRSKRIEAQHTKNGNATVGPKLKRAKLAKKVCTVSENTTPPTPTHSSPVQSITAANANSSPVQSITDAVANSSPVQSITDAVANSSHPQSTTSAAANLSLAQSTSTKKAKRRQAKNNNKKHRIPAIDALPKFTRDL